MHGYQIGRRVMLLALFSILPLIGINQSAQGQLIFDGQILDRTGAWDGYPTITFINGVHHIWWCSSHADSTGGDAVYHATKPTQLGPGGWTVHGEVVNHLLSPVATDLTCDPSLVKGDFVFESVHYAYALYYTYNTGSGGTDNAVAVAFSNNGADFEFYSDPVILPDDGFTGLYGAGASSAAWGPNVGVLNTWYYDTSHPGGGLGQVRYKSSTDGIAFTPTPSLPTSLALGFGPANFAGSPDVAYSPVLREWFAETGRLDALGPNNELILELLIIRSHDGLEPTAEWSEVGRIDTALTGQAWNVEGGLARFSDSSLYIDRNGYGYLLFGAGEEVSAGPTWRIFQVRFPVLSSPPLILDSFQHFGIFRTPGGNLGGTQTELGQRSWTAESTLVLDSSPGRITNSSGTGSHIGGFPFATSEEPAAPATYEVLLGRGGAGWGAVGLATSPTGGLFASGGAWVLVHSGQDQYEIYANGFSQIASGAVPNLNPDFNFVRLEYVQGTNRLSVAINGTTVLTSHLLSFSPAFSNASIHLASPAGGDTAGDQGVRNLRINGAPYHLFLDGFETSDMSRWSVSDP
jgi:hypothetical protein